MSAENNIICWDLDETLGSFRAFHYQSKLREKTALSQEKIDEYQHMIEDNPAGLKFGVKKLLQELSEDGFNHVITTASSYRYARNIILRAGLLNNFERIFDGKIISPDWGKLYRPVAEHFKMSDEEACERMIAIGDGPGDQPTDIEGLVFIRHALCCHFDSTVLKNVLGYLRGVTNLGFQKSFEYLYANPEEIQNEGKPYEIRYVSPANDIRLELKYSVPSMFSASGKRTVPIINIEPAESYLRTLALIQ